MQIICRFYRFLVLCSVLGFHKGLPKFFFGGLVLMDCFITFSKHLILDYELGCRFVLFGFSRFLWLFLFFGLGMKFLYSGRFVRVSIRFLCDLIRELKSGFCLENVLDGKKSKFLTLVDTDFVGKTNISSDEESDADSNEESESDSESEYDVSILRKLLRDERRKAKVALEELAKERWASASAAEEAMAMILRLQNEKSLIELELHQYKRLSEEKQIHDQEVIRSLQWLVWRHESGRSLLEDQLKVYRRKRKDECEETKEDETYFDGNILDALENVFYSSRDANLLSE
ncbi:hypothetical protein OROHE_018998 [Orobanche hederae]